MNTISKKVKQFNKIFTREEKALIILGSIATLLAVALGLFALMSLITRVLNWYIDLTAPYILDSLNKLVGALFPGWKLM